MEELIKGLLGTVYKIPETEIADLLKSDGTTEGLDDKKILQFIVDKDKERISKIKADSAGTPAKWDDAVKKATKDVWSKVEKTLKDEFGVDSDLQGEELVNFVSEKAKENGKNSGKKGELTDDDVKKHPVYLKAETDFKKKFADQETEKANAIKEAEEKFTQKEFLSKVRKAALLKFKGLSDVILPSDPKKAEKMIQKLLVDELDAYDYQDDGNGNYLVLYKDGDRKGKRVEDAHANAIGFDALVENIAKSNFEVKVASDRKSPANGSSEGGDAGKGKTGEKKYTGKAPANKEEYLGLLTAEDLTTDQKLEVTQQYGAQFSKN